MKYSKITILYVILFKALKELFTPKFQFYHHLLTFMLFQTQINKYTGRNLAE